MKKYIFIIFLMLSLTVLVSCAGNEVSDFVSFEDNLLLTYEAEGEINMTFQIFNAYTTGSRLQRRIMSDVGSGSVWSEVLEIRDNQLVMINAQDTQSHTSIIANPPHMQEIILAGPIRLGNSWTINPHLEGSAQREITGINISVTTPAGTFETIEVTTFHADSNSFLEPPRTREYFAPGIGVVKSISYGGIPLDSAENFIEEQSTVRLIDIQRGYGLSQTAAIFYDIDGNFPLAQILHLTNNNLSYIYTPLAREALARIFDTEPNEDIIINYAVVNPDANILNLDFSDAFVVEMANTLSYEHERQVLGAIATTFGFLYDVAGVHITVNGQPYSSGVITLGHTEILHVGQGVWDE